MVLVLDATAITLLHGKMRDIVLMTPALLLVMEWYDEEYIKAPLISQLCSTDGDCHRRLRFGKEKRKMKGKH